MINSTNAISLNIGEQPGLRRSKQQRHETASVVDVFQRSFREAFLERVTGVEA